MERLLNYWKRSFNFNRLILHFWKVFNSTGVMISIAGLYAFYVCVFSLFSGLNVVWNLFFCIILKSIYMCVVQTSLIASCFFFKIYTGKKFRDAFYHFLFYCFVCFFFATMSFCFAEMNFVFSVWFQIKYVGLFTSCIM